MADDSRQSIKGDRALGVDDKDMLGFRDVAEQIAVSLTTRATKNGLVIGLEGSWGSGKSSLLHLIGKELERLGEPRIPIIIHFRPWLIGNRDALIASLFSEISHKLDEVALKAGDASRANREKAKKANKALRRFLGGLSKAGSLVEFAGKASGIGLIEIAGEGVKSLGDATEDDFSSPPLADLKDKLAQSLRKLDRRFVVTIDDVDRLEPSEVIEILRLVRSVVDLPNIVYLLCYDEKILAHSIETATGVKSGQSYLEKIVQLTVMVPRPESLQLRQWFSDELHSIASTKGEDENSRLQIIIDHEGGRQLHTPRSVIRALDAMRFSWPSLSKYEADLADLVWIQLIKDGNSRLYRWIEDYCAISSAISLRIARIDEAEKNRVLDELISIVGKDYFADRMYRHYFAEQLPGFEIDFSQDGNNIKIFCAVSEYDRDKAIRDKRLASPDHYRLYFASTAPSHVLSQEEFSEVWMAAETGIEPLGSALLRLNLMAASGSLTKVDLLLERVQGGAYGVLSPPQCEHLLLSFSNVLDQAYRDRPFDVFWIGNLWSRAQRLIPLLLSRFDPLQRKSIIAYFFEEGGAIGWLTSLLRHENFAHGLHGSRQRPEEEWLFTREELEKIISIMLGRYRAMSMSDIISSPSAISILFAWSQAGDSIGPRRIVESSIKSEEGLIDTLEELTSKIRSSSRGSFEILDRKNLESFLDFDEVRRRIYALKEHSRLGERARRLIVKFEDADRF